jgi:methylene-tetrahydromethanopterin dehydrogenase
MEKPYILHLFTPMAQASPFDINMAYDAGYDGVVPYTNVEPRLQRREAHRNFHRRP